MDLKGRSMSVYRRMKEGDRLQNGDEYRWLDRTEPWKPVEKMMIGDLCGNEYDGIEYRRPVKSGQPSGGAGAAWPEVHFINYVSRDVVSISRRPVVPRKGESVCFGTLMTAWSVIDVVHDGDVTDMVFVYILKGAV